MNAHAINTLSTLVERLNNPALPKANVIPWSCPVPSFGDLTRSRVATVGINPSNREFVDMQGNELDGENRRFHTLNSLGLASWSRANEKHFQLITDSCKDYFNRNPYNGWFKSLDNIIAGTHASFYGKSNKACHLDLIPYATANKWTELTSKQRALLIELAGDTLALLLQNTPIRLLILNGRAVIEHLQAISGTTLSKREIASWTLFRNTGQDVTGYAYKGIINEMSGIKLKREVRVLGFNHNIQSSFGVTSKVKTSIKQWIARNAKEGI